MAYPSQNDVASEANTYGFDQLIVFAYAAVHASLPSGGDAHTLLSSFQQQVDTQAASWNLPGVLLYGYIQQSGLIPSTANQVTSWAHGENFLDSNGNLQTAPPPGHNYPGIATNTTSTTASTNSTNTSSSNPLDFLTKPVNIGGMQVSPVAIGAVGVGALFVLPALFGHHRR